MLQYNKIIHIKTSNQNGMPGTSWYTVFFVLVTAIQKLVEAYSDLIYTIEDCV
jgi:hypothetical protein